MEAEGAYATVMPAQAGSGRAAISTSRGTPASPGEFTTTSRLTPFRCSFSGSSRCRATASASGWVLPWVVSGSSSARRCCVRASSSLLQSPSLPEPVSRTQTGSPEGRTFGESLLGGLERGGLACEGAILALELLLQLEHLAAELAPLTLEVVEELVLLLGERLEGQELADAFIDGLGLAEQAGLPVVLRGGERPRGPSGHLVDEAACQPLLPAGPGVTRLPGAGQGQGEGGERRLARCQRRIEPFRAPQPGLFVTRRGRGPGPEGVVMLALTVERRGQAVVALGGVGVARAQGRELDRQGTAVHRLGLGGLPLVMEGQGQVVVAGGGVGVVRAQGRELDRQGTAVHRLGLGVLPLVMEGLGQV